MTLLPPGVPFRPIDDIDIIPRLSISASRSAAFAVFSRGVPEREISVQFSHACFFDVRRRSVLTDKFTGEDDDTKPRAGREFDHPRNAGCNKQCR
jgi:hypothetical protein